jgi:hypothetical protein
MQTPSSQLAAKIIDRLVREKLLTLEESKKILSKIAEGKARAEDWRLAIEISEEKETKA